MTITTAPVSNADALKYADEMEAALSKLASGKLKPGQLPLEPVCRLIQFARDTVSAKVMEQAKHAAQK